MGLTPGQRVDHDQYEIVRELGRGRFGITYLARRTDDQSRWAIKILNPELLATATEPERQRLKRKFWQEAVKLAQCSGRTPYIVQAGMPFEAGEMVCLPMEYVDGLSLADRADRILPQTLALKYIQQIGEALAVVHQQGLVHRDIRPGNILVRMQRQEAVLTDFGLAMACDTELTTARTQERKDGFAPLELYLGETVGRATDIYGLAATLYELLTGEIPVSALERKANNVELIPPRVKNPEISSQVAKAIASGMALQADQRPRSVQDWFNQLGLKPDAEPVPAKTVNWEKWGVIWAAVAAIVGGIALIPVFMDSFKPESTDPTPTNQPSP
ncbi:MAG: serine/threonine protein kinase [Spirulina sp. SIO3F2]|nr:serine/threonine protein kinase [Spirulina sp. SIO3F2]